MSEFEPKMIGFLCNWCSYAGADLAGVSRFQYPTNIRSVRVMCSTRVSSHIILEILKAGADGVLVGGCHLNDCHYINGNFYTLKRIKMTKRLMELAGIDPDRLRLEWISASEGEKFASVVRDFTEQIRQLGPTPVKTDERIRTRLQAAIDASKCFRLKALTGKEIKVTEQGNAYEELIDQGRYDDLSIKAAEEEFKRHMILELTKTAPMSVKELAQEMEEPTNTVLECVSTLRGRNLIALDSIDGFTPKYKAMIMGGA
jgi:F420-non-reducing hydrogenase iron-sulfur subunit